MKKNPMSRREILLAAGAGLSLGAAGCRLDGERAEAWRDGNGNGNGHESGPKDPGPSREPLLLGPEGSKDPAEHSRIETLFWAERLKEHAYFFALLMPGHELEIVREESERFVSDWHRRLDRAKTAFDSRSYAEFNLESIHLARRMSDWKKRMADEQASGALRSLVWPSFFEAASKEADYFIRRLEAYNDRKVELRRDEVVDFWAHDTAGHLAMIGHFLDPQETERVTQALEMSRRWQNIRAEKPKVEGADPVLQAEREVIDFKQALAKGVDAGTIRSILRPIMLEHMRREALRFVDELRRSA